VKTRSQKSADVERRFRETVILLGAVFAPGAFYQGANTAVTLICRLGHICNPWPASVQRGRGVCRTCTGTDRAVAEAAFWVRVVELGATPAPGAVYRGANTAVPLICAKGHTCNPWPTSVQQGHGVCGTCAGNDQAAAAAAFWVRVALADATPAPGAVYQDAHTPVTLICVQGHVCSPRPNDVQKGHGICGECNVSFDRVYLVKHESTGAIKVGVSSGDSRVKRHAGRGYELVAQWLGLTHAGAHEVEDQVKAWWRDHGWPPVAAAPKDGRTETAGLEHLGDTQAWMIDRLGEGTCPEAV